MTPLALVLAAATCHATWNVLLKRAGGGGPLFLWLTFALGLMLYVPAAIAVACSSGHPSVFAS